jgi:cobalt-precorrin 5A hydrolase/precorrin-3B C17-methyltransferase
VYPIVLTSPRRAVVVGGGPVGERKVRGLLAVGAVVKLVSPEATEQLAAWAADGQISWAQRVYQPNDLARANLVFTATDDRAVNAQVARDAAGRGLLCNVADAPGEGSFHVPAVYRGDGLLITVSTDGLSPAWARQVRDRIAAWIKEECLV